MTTRDLLIVLLLFAEACLALLALLYLRKRRLPWAGYLFWGLVALVPVIGPFIVILSHPGDP